MENMDKGLTVHTKMGADKLAKNSPNAQKFICPSPKVWDFDEKRLHWVSVVRAFPSWKQNRSLVGLKSRETFCQSVVNWMTDCLLELVLVYLYRRLGKWGWNHFWKSILAFMLLCFQDIHYIFKYPHYLLTVRSILTLVGASFHLKTNAAFHEFLIPSQRIVILFAIEKSCNEIWWAENFRKTRNSFLDENLCWTTDCVMWKLRKCFGKMHHSRNQNVPSKSISTLGLVRLFALIHTWHEPRGHHRAVKHC